MIQDFGPGGNPDILRSNYMAERSFLLNAKAVKKGNEEFGKFSSGWHTIQKT